MKISIIVLACLALTATMISGCQKSAAPPGPDLAALQKQILQKQDVLLQIHLDLDSAASEISDAEISAQDGNCSAAEFHAAEAYRKLRAADDAILDLGRDLQAMFNLDREKANL